MSSSSTTTSLSLDHLPPSEQLCYVHCTICDTLLAVSVPCSSLFKTVTVRCGHCSNILPVNMRRLVSPSTNHVNFVPSFFSSSHNLLNEIPNPSPKFLTTQTNAIDFGVPQRRAADHELPRPPVINRSPEKRQRVPSAYNRFIKDEIQRIKAVNPDISHREAFSAAAKNTVKKTNVCQEADDVLMKDGFSASANVGITPF